jgi:hypothetical protein
VTTQYDSVTIAAGVVAVQLTPWGIWATPDSEIVLTPKVLLIYQRTPDLLCARVYEGRESDYHLLALSASYWGRDWCLASLAGDHRPAIEGNHEGAVRLLDAAERSIHLSPGDLPAPSWLDGAAQPLLVEPVRISIPFAGQAASTDNVGRCLSIWPMGTTVVRDSHSPVSFALMVNTPTHWCIYENWDSGEGFSIYCRCARVATSNLGMVFVQNVKMSISEQKSLHQCFMSEDNLRAAQASLEVDPSRFDSSDCAFIGPEGREWGTIYWSVKHVTPDRITLHGCEGKEYVHKRPTGAAGEKLEYFATTDLE